MKNKYIFPAILDYADDGISIFFPDLPGCFSCADETEEAIRNAKEALELHIWSMEKDNEIIPTSSSIKDINIKKNQIPVLISIWMPLVRSEMDNKSVKKTLTIPAWLNLIAEREKVNFSKILQEALKEYLNIKNKKTNP